MDDVAGAPRRTTRAALAEIPARLGQLRVSPPPQDLIAAIPAQASPDAPRHALLPNTRLNTPGDAPSTLLSPTPSPDELVIQQRGRKRMPVTWSPDIDFRKSTSAHPMNRTPPKSPNRINGIVLRSTPKKRVLLHEFDRAAAAASKNPMNDHPPIATPTKSPRTLLSPVKSPPAKRLKLEPPASELDEGVPLDAALKAMSHEQLVGIVKGIADARPDVERQLRKSLPAADLRPAEERLQYLRRQIYRSLPASRLTSKTDSPAYSRANSHLLAFKKQLVDHGRLLLESQRWRAVLEYATFAWSHVRATPLWDNHAHNGIRRQCFKYLAGMFMQALKRGRLEAGVLKEVQASLEGMMCDSDDVQSCLKWIDVQLRSTGGA